MILEKAVKVYKKLRNRVYRQEKINFRGWTMVLNLNVRIFLALLVALILTIIPIPNLFSNFRPPCVLLVVLYIQFFLPRYFHLFKIVILGLCLDGLLSTILGEHILALVITSWIASSRVSRFHIFSLSQQMALIIMLGFIYQFIIYLIELYQGYNNTLPMVLGTTLVTMLVWPWVNLLLDRFFSRRCIRQSVY